MATAAELKPDQNYRVPHGFFTSGLSEIDPAVEEAVRDELRRSRPRRGGKSEDPWLRLELLEDLPE